MLGRDGTENRGETVVGWGTAVWPDRGPHRGGRCVLGISVEGKFWSVGLWGQSEGSYLVENKWSSGMSILGLCYKVVGQK